ncbi:MAG: hypothetical protein JNK23_10540 [Opitutaceae bacterium]|nr:hypothetical protein [Opitutaceae bacterium]
MKLVRFPLFVALLFLAGCASLATQQKFRVEVFPANAHVQLLTAEGTLLAEKSAEAGVATLLFPCSPLGTETVVVRASAPGYEAASARTQANRFGAVLHLVPGQPTFRERVAERAEKAAQAEREHAEKRAAYVAAHPQLSAGTKAAIMRRWFVVGMTRQDVEVSMGLPRSRLEDGGVGGSAEAWFYETVTLYFVGDKVVRWTIYSG